MATNSILPIAAGTSADVLSQEEYAALTDLTTGFPSGILPRRKLNKVLRQVSLIAAAVAQVIADSGSDVTDSMTAASIATLLKNAILSGDGSVSALTAALAATAPGNGASKVGLNDAAGNWDATNLESLAAEVYAKIRKPIVTAAAMQPALSAGGGYRIKDGVYNITTTLSTDYSSTSFPVFGEPSTRTDFVGDSQSNTIVIQNTAGQGGITVTGRADAVYQGVHALDRISNATFTRTTAGTGTGVAVSHKAYTAVSDLTVTKYAFGLYANGVLSSQFENLYLTGNGIGAVVSAAGSALLPNANVFYGCRFSDSITAGLVANASGATNLVLSGSTENGGTTGTSGAGGAFLNVTGANGLATWTYLAHYFEANGGDADLTITNTSAYPVTVLVMGCTFNRVLATRYTNVNIRCVNSGGGSIKCVLIACGFLSAGSYVPNAARPFWQGDASTEFFVGGITYNETTSMPVSCRASSSMVAAAFVESNGVALSQMPPGVTVTKTGTGVYRITKAGGWAIDQFGYVVSANASSSVNRANAMNVSAAAFDVYTTTPLGVAVDERFSFMTTTYH